MLVLMGKPEASLLEMKAYLHSGLLNMVWKVYGESEKTANRDRGSWRLRSTEPCAAALAARDRS
jgi:hypothetical protein